MIGKCVFSVQERNKPAAVDVINETRWEQMNDDATEVMKVVQQEERDSESNTGGPAAAEDDGSEDAGRGQTKMRKMVSQPLGHLPSLALSDLNSIDGVLQRPCESHTGGVRAPSADSNDSDSISAYEDASAETPEQDRLFGGDEELPDDGENGKKPPSNNCQADDTEESENPNQCFLS